MNKVMVAVIAVIAVAAVTGGVAFAVISNNNANDGGDDAKYDTTAKWKVSFSDECISGGIVYKPSEGNKYAHIELLFPEAVTLPIGNVLLTAGGKDYKAYANLGDNPLPSGKAFDVTPNVWYDKWFEVPEDTQDGDLSLRWISAVGSFDIKFIRV